MKRMVSAREIVGKRIVAFRPGPFPDGRGGVAHDPAIELEDGTILRFVTEETDVGDYGTFIGRYKRPAKKAK